MKPIPLALKRGLPAETITDKDDVETIVRKIENSTYVIDGRKKPTESLQEYYMLAKRKTPEPQKTKHKFF